MTDKFPPCLAFTWRKENDGQPLHITPGDAGGATAWGVTIGTWNGWRAMHKLPAMTVQQFAAVPQSDLADVYHMLFWNAVVGDQLPAGVDLMVYDFGVGGGPGTSAKLLQRVVGVAEDGRIGPITLRAVQARNAPLISDLLTAQNAYYAALADYPEFGHGWTRRAHDRATLAMQMANPMPA